MTQPPQAQLLITLNADGTIAVNGPIQNKVLCYGMLGCARDAIHDFAAQQARSAIVPARPADPMLIHPRRNGDATGG